MHFGPSRPTLRVTRHLARPRPAPDPTTERGEQPMTTLTGTVLLYNASFEPLGRVSFQHAVKMLVREVAVVHEAARPSG